MKHRVGTSYKVGIITLSDKGFRGEREDKSGPAIRKRMEAERNEDGRKKYEVVREMVLPDDQMLLERTLISMCDEEGLDLILTTGGTGFSRRDVTPEATMAVATRNAPGIAEYLRSRSSEITPKAMLSRGASVIRHETLIVNLPGSPKAVREEMEFLIPALEHGLNILLGRDSECGSEPEKHGESERCGEPERCGASEGNGESESLPDIRYERNRIFSAAEQKKLEGKKAAVIGCGGLGGYLIEMLGRMGVGHIVACDGDAFSPSNLNRQLFSTEQNMGVMKAVAAAEHMRLVNSQITVESVCEYLSEENGQRVLDGCDVVLDGLDSVQGKLMLQRICRNQGLPMVHGAIGGWLGQVTTVFPGDDTLSMIYQEGDEVSQEQGNPAFTPAVIAGIQIGEAAKVLLGYEAVLRRKMLFIDLLTGEVEKVEL